MLKSALLLTLAFCALAGSPAQAESVNERQRHQGSRTYSGINSGELTRHEAGQVSQDMARIQRVENRFRQSGSGYSARERCATQSMLNRNSRQVYRLKHNGRSR